MQELIQSLFTFFEGIKRDMRSPIGGVANKEVKKYPQNL